MSSPSGGNSILEEFQKQVRFYTRGDLSAAEVINCVLVRLAESERFDLVEETVGLLPEPVREELRRTVEKILGSGSGYKGPSIIGRASEEWRVMIRQRIGRLAQVFRPLLETL
jgi:hypothetical protein